MRLLRLPFDFEALLGFDCSVVYIGLYSNGLCVGPAPPRVALIKRVHVNIQRWQGICRLEEFAVPLAPAPDSSRRNSLTSWSSTRSSLAKTEQNGFEWLFLAVRAMAINTDRVGWPGVLLA